MTGTFLSKPYIDTHPEARDLFTRLKDGDTVWVKVRFDEFHEMETYPCIVHFKDDGIELTRKQEKMPNVFCDENIKTINLKRGDVVIVYVRGNTTSEEKAHLEKYFSDVFPNNRTVILNADRIGLAVMANDLQEKVGENA